MTSCLSTETTKILITQSMLDNLEYDQDMDISSKTTFITPESSESMVMLVFHQSDIEAATYHLAQSLDNRSFIGCVFVQESCVEKFSSILKSKLKTYTKEQLQSLHCKETIEKSNEIIARLNAKTISPETPASYACPLVWNFSQEHFVVDGKSLPIVSLFSFRTVKEAIALVKKECGVSKGVTIWCENHTMAYEVVAATPLRDFYLNCFNISWNPIAEYIKKGQPFVAIEKSFHYETLLMDGKQKNIVFPFGTIFAN